MIGNIPVTVYVHFNSNNLKYAAFDPSHISYATTDASYVITQSSALGSIIQSLPADQKACHELLERGQI
jgi:hypothetical protein